RKVEPGRRRDHIQAASPISPTNGIGFTSETGRPNVRAMVPGLTPAPNDARTRFAFPSGISGSSAAPTRDANRADPQGAEPVSSVLPAEVPCPHLAISA